MFLDAKKAAVLPHCILDTFYDLVAMLLCIASDTYDGMVIIDISSKFVFNHSIWCIYDSE